MKTQNSKTIELTVTAALALCLVVALAIPPRAAAQDDWHRRAAIITFDPPGSILTAPCCITPAGLITGLWLDGNKVGHAFLRAPDGDITTFDVPGAGTGAGQGTAAESINPEGAITGLWVDGTAQEPVVHGFLRDKDGTFTTFDAPGACACGYGTRPYNINPAGAIAGQYLDTSNVWHGFLRSPDGTITTFEAPGAGTGKLQGTVTSSVEGLNPEGAIAGASIDASGVNHGFLRAPDGTITLFNVPGAGTGSGQGTETSGINRADAIPGNYIDASGVNHGYVRAADGTITKFNVRGAGTGSGQGTLGEAINPRGAITGFYIDASGVYHGFLRAPDGAITTFDAPGAGTSSGQGTFSLTNNPADAITGWYIDASGVQHGFLRTPCGREGDQGYRTGCEDDDQGMTAETRANPAPNASFSGALSPILGRMLPWYRNVSAQPATP